jgi:hypothetical protein
MRSFWSILRSSRTPSSSLLRHHILFNQIWCPPIIYLSIHISISVSIYLSIYLSIFIDLSFYP